MERTSGDDPGPWPRRAVWRDLLPLLALGSLLRIYRIGHQSLWLDEAYSWWFSAFDVHRALAAERTNPPLYYLALHFWTSVFGTSESALRTMSVLPSLAVIGLTYLLARRLFDRKVGLVAGLYASVSPFQIAYAQEARAFALLCCFVLLAAWSLQRALATRGEPRYLVTYGLSAIAALCTHFIAVFYIFGQALFALAHVRKEKPLLLRWLFTYVVIGALFLPLLIGMLSAARGGGQVRRHPVLKLPQAFFSLLFGDSLIPTGEVAIQNIGATLSANMHWLLAGVAVAAMVVAILLTRRRATDSVVFCLVLGVLPVLLSFLVSFKVVHFDRRYHIASSPFVYVMVAAAIAHGAAFSTWDRIAKFTTGALLAILLAVSLRHYYFDPRFGKEPWRQVTRDIQAAKGPHDVVVFDPGYIYPSFDYYARSPTNRMLIGRAQRAAIARNVRAFISKLPSDGEVWLVRSHYDDDLVLGAIARYLKLEREFHYRIDKGIDVYVFRTIPT